MKHPGKDFYENWAAQELAKNTRARILKWKAANLANLVLRSLPPESGNSVCEIGGAEGTVLYFVSQLISSSQMTNYELSSTFCEEGKNWYPEINFINFEFNETIDSKYDMIILSDIIEHVEDDDKFLKIVRTHCKYVLLKIPIEICLTSSSWYHFIRGKKKPPYLQYGRGHYNGHLRGYTTLRAKNLVKRHFFILDEHASNVGYFYSNTRQRKIIKRIGNRITIWLYGGALFLLGKSRD
jgi:hypothetical protein